VFVRSRLAYEFFLPDTFAVHQGAHSDENGHLFRRKAATYSDPKRPLLPLLDLGGVIDAVG
jgi:hypothetical protein